MPWVGCLYLTGLYATWEKEQTSALAGLPLAVVGRGRVQDYCRRAGKKGVRAGMPLLKAKLLCPGLVDRLYREEAYSHLQEGVCRQVTRFTPRYEPLFPHEVFFELTGEDIPLDSLRELDHFLVPRWGHRVVFGLGKNKLVARAAAHLARQGKLKGPGLFSPAGNIAVVRPGREADFLAPLGVSYLWPVSPGARKRLMRLGFSTLGQVRDFPLSWLRREFKDEGELIYRLSRGVDKAPLAPGPEPAWEYRTSCNEEMTGEGSLAAFLAWMARRLVGRLEKEGKVCREVALTLEYQGGEEQEASRSLSSFQEQNLSTFLTILLQLRRHLPGEKPVTGVRVSGRGLGLAAPRQGDLLGHLLPPAKSGEEKQAQLATSLALLQAKYPGLQIALGRDHCPSRRERMLACWDPFRFRGVRGNG